MAGYARSPFDRLRASGKFLVPPAPPFVLSPSTSSGQACRSMNGHIGKNRSHLEAKMHHVPVLHYVVFPLQAHLARLTAARLATVADVVVVGDDFGADEAAFDVRMDLPGGFDRRRAARNRPRPRLHRPGGEETDEVEHGVGLLNEAVAGRVGESEVGEKGAALLFLELSDFHLVFAAVRIDGASLALRVCCYRWRHVAVHAGLRDIADDE